MRSFLQSLAVVMAFAMNANSLDFCTPKGYANRLHGYLTAKTRVVDEFPDAQKLELPQSAIEAIKAYDFSSLTEKYPNGRELAIGVGPAHLHRALFMGEYIQSDLIMKTLKQIFPEATVTHGEFNEVWKSSHPEIKTIHLNVLDTAEMGNDQDDLLDMPILKAANPTLQALRGVDVRSQFGIPPEKLSVSYYFKRRSFSTPGFPDVSALLKKSEEIGHAPDVVFLTLGGRSMIYPTNSVLNFSETQGYDVIALSKLTHKLDPNKKYIILNDMLGKLPYLDRASNVSVRIGPINIFESLAVGTPTVYFENPEALVGYDVQAFSKMSHIAQKTGAGYPVKDIDDFGKKLTHVIDSPSIPAPPDPGAFEEYLDHLSNLLKRKLLANKH